MVRSMQEVLITPCADKFRRPRQLSAASKALLKYAADEERQLRDFLSAGGCKGLHTPHVCPYGSRRITLPRFFTVRRPLLSPPRRAPLSAPLRTTAARSADLISYVVARPPAGCHGPV